jgi:hypothetical protein
MLASGVGVVLAANALAADGTGDRGVTVGRFATQIASALGDNEHSAAVVGYSLRALGIEGGLEAREPLTAGTAAEFAAILGVRIAPPARADGRMSSSQATALVGHIASLYIEVNGIPPEPPNQCLTSLNRGFCVDCCKVATGLKGQYCGRFCRDNVSPPPSPEEPMP